MTRKAGFSATRQSIILLGFGGIIIEDQTTRSLYWRRQNVAQLLRQIRTRHRSVKQPIGGEFSIKRTHGLFVQMVTLSKVSIGAVALGYITSKKLNAVNRIHFQIDMSTAITRISYLRLTIKD